MVEVFLLSTAGILKMDLLQWSSSKRVNFFLLIHSYSELINNKNTAQDSSGDSKTLKANWDAIHVVEVKEGKGTASYKLTSTIMVSIDTSSKATGKISLAGSVTRQQETSSPFDKKNNHILNIGRAIEGMENKLRQLINVIYFSKTLDVVNVVRQIIENSLIEKNKSLAGEVTKGMKN